MNQTELIIILSENEKLSAAVTQSNVLDSRTTQSCSINCHEHKEIIKNCTSFKKRYI